MWIRALLFVFLALSAARALAQPNLIELGYQTTKRGVTWYRSAPPTHVPAWRLSRDTNAVAWVDRTTGLQYDWDYSASVWRTKGVISSTLPPLATETSGAATLNHTQAVWRNAAGQSHRYDAAESAWVPVGNFIFQSAAPTNVSASGSNGAALRTTSLWQDSDDFALYRWDGSAWVPLDGVGGIYGVSDTTQPAHVLTIAAASTLTFQSQGDNSGGIVPFRVKSDGSEPDIMGFYANGDSLIVSRSDTEFLVSSTSGVSIASGAVLSLQGDSVILAAVDAALSGEKTYLQITSGGVVKSSEGIPLAHLNQSGATTGQVPTWSGTAWVPDDPAGVTDLSYSGTSSPVTLNSSTGTDVTATAGTGISLAATSSNLTITNTGDTNASDDITGSGAANQFAYFSGSQAITGSSGFTKNGNNLLVGPSGGDHVEIMPGTSEISLFNVGTIDARIFANDFGRIETNVGLNVVGNSAVTGNLDVSGSITTSSHFRAPGISSGPSGLAATASGTLQAWSPTGTSPYVTFSETAIANRGAFGFPASSGDFVWTVGNQVLSSGTERMRLTNGGNLGIGAASPSQRLHVNGSAILGYSLITDAFGEMTMGNKDLAAFGTNFAFTQNSIGNTVFNGLDLFFRTGNTTRAYISAAGNLGIGEASPSQRLHVNGNARVTGAYYDSNNEPGTSGQILSSTVTGTDWVAASTLGDNWGSQVVMTTGSTLDGNGTTGAELKVNTNGITANEIAANAVGASELAATTVTAGSYGSATSVATYTVDADGRLTAAANAAITGLLSGLTATRIPFASGANALTDDANLTWNNTTKRLSVGNTGGSPTAAVHIAEGSVATWEPLRAAGTVSGSMVTTLLNAQNSGGASNNFVDLSVGGASAGDPAYRWLINGVDTWSMGVDNSDSDKMKWKKATSPSTLSNVGLTMTADATPLIGINNDAPLHPLHVIGRATATVLQGISGTPTHTFGTGAGTSPSLGTLTGCTNGFNLQITIGTSPTVGGNIISITLPTAFSNLCFPTYSCGNDRTALENAAGKFVISAASATALTIKHNALTPALTAGDVLFFRFNLSGR